MFFSESLRSIACSVNLNFSFFFVLNYNSYSLGGFWHLLESSIGCRSIIESVLSTPLYNSNNLSGIELMRQRYKKFFTTRKLKRCTDLFFSISGTPDKNFDLERIKLTHKSCFIHFLSRLFFLVKKVLYYYDDFYPQFSR